MEIGDKRIKVKTTKKHFGVFKAEANKWIRNFGLTDWNVCFSHTKLEGIKARCEYNLVGRVATLSLSTTYTDSIIDYDIESAFHEVCELLIIPLESMIEQRYALGVDDVREETHRIIRRLENFILKEDLN
ncbi:hypothetical protein LCGC14_0812950 [marine sediment metagenome]|uniref:Uncharacterized protein n=1 Tax=marine sediment metagenome TaxID=412755 RepID=A0A0F9PL56_9ZZZZ